MWSGRPAALVHKPCRPQEEFGFCSRCHRRVMWGHVPQMLRTPRAASPQRSCVCPARAAPYPCGLLPGPARCGLQCLIHRASSEWSFAVATITEIPPVIFLPNFLVQRKVLKPLRTQTGGTIMAGKLAVERGWAINIGGGFHHCSSDRGGGFCAYADITLAIKFLFERVEGVSRATIVDLDAHQGNGHERDFMGDKRVYIMDVYNRHIYPGDRFAKQAIRRKVELEWGTEDDDYLRKVERNLERALQEHQPDVVVYNAGTDVLEGDRLGGLSISPQGVVKRDELVFRLVRGHQVPILMVTSGGYQKRTARIIADSILNLYGQGLIGPQSANVSAQNSDTPLLPLEVP
ncbi:histone deacetylase 11 isoform X1 [Delphinapterus leucas]|uniref:Histone deacetylase 11 n=1 Tax=Delphinapterus leucas TaxID=9749 RepID=A0A7F8K252_DELLE|nr:histone deacetylase 11 isoform X1 [Delphinapterus leucas]